MLLSGPCDVQREYTRVIVYTKLENLILNPGSVADVEKKLTMSSQDLQANVL
jgi:hypothetical protein